MLRSESENSRLIWLIVLSGLALRLFGLASESYWLDEIMAAHRVHEPVSQLLFGWDSKTQGPLYYLWIKAWGLMFGTGEFSLRFWSVVWGTLTIVYVYQLGRQLFTGTGAVLAALFIAVHPFAIHYSQEARPYALFLLLCVVSYYYLLRLLRLFRWQMATLYAIVTIAAFYTHPFGMFLIATHVAMFLVFRRDSHYRSAARYAQPYVILLLIILATCLPEAVQNLSAAFEKIDGPSQAGWIPRPTVLTLFKTPLEYFMDFRVGLIIIPLVTIFAIVRVLSEPQLRNGFQWMVIVGTCFWLIPWAASLVVTPIFITRYTSPGLLVVIYLMSTAAASLQAWPRMLFVAILLLLTAFPLWNYYTKVDKDPWRQTADYLAERVKPDDCIICYPLFASPALKYYLPDYLAKQYYRPNSNAELNQILAESNRVWEITSYNSDDSINAVQVSMIEDWGNELRGVTINDELPMNPTRFWAVPIHVSLRQQTEAFQGPEAPPEINK